MDKLDKLFLTEYVNNIFMSHIMTAIALYSSGEPESLTMSAGLLRKFSDGLSDDVAFKVSQELNDPVRVHNLIIPKLFAEYVATMEDVGALVFAIKNRNDSIFKRYYKSEPKDVTHLYESIKDDDYINKVLLIPSIDELKRAKQAIDIDGFATSYENITNALKVLAKEYTTLGQHLNAKKAIEDGDSRIEDALFVILRVIPKNSNGVVATKGVFPRAYNKIKHRFLVFSDLKELLNASQDYEITLMPLSRSPESVEMLHTRIIGVSRYGAEIAAIALTLGNHGLI